MKVLAAGLTVTALGLAFLPWPPAPWLALVLVAGVGLWLEPAALRRAWAGRTLVTMILASGATAVLVALSSDPPRGLRAGLGMLLRLAVLVVVTTLAARHVDHEAWRRGLDHLGLARMGLICGLALNTLPHLVEAWRDAWVALAVRRRRRRPRWRDLPALCETMLAHTGRLAEETAIAAALRGSLALVARPAELEGVPLVVVVTGRSGSGKTPALTRLVQNLQARHVPAFGFLQPPVWEGGDKVGFDVVDIRGGERAPLGRRVARGGEHHTPFVFDPVGFALARCALRCPPPGAVLVVDEIGPVELRGDGHWPALVQAWRRGRPRAAVLALRRQLIPAFLAQLGAIEAVVVDAEVEPDPTAALLAVLEGAFQGIRRSGNQQDGSSGGEDQPELC